MNSLFWILVIIFLVNLWLIISFVFVPLGQIVIKQWDKTMKILNKEEVEEQSEEKEKEYE